MKLLVKIAFTFVITFSLVNDGISQSVFTPENLLGIERVSTYQLSPDGGELIYSIYTPRGPNDKPGGGSREYFRMDMTTMESKPLFQENFKGSSPQYSHNGQHIAFLYKKGDDSRQIWVMPTNGGDTIRVTNSENNINSFKWIPDGSGMAYLVRDPKTPKPLTCKNIS